jgi:hypothetical protein
LAKGGLPLPLTFGPARPRSQFQKLNKNPHLSTIALDASPCQVSVGKISDVGLELNRDGSIAAIPEMEREQGEEKACPPAVWRANRDTN